MKNGKEKLVKGLVFVGSMIVGAIVSTFIKTKPESEEGLFDDEAMVTPTVEVEETEEVTEG